MDLAQKRHGSADLHTPIHPPPVGALIFLLNMHVHVYFEKFTLVMHYCFYFLVRFFVHDTVQVYLDDFMPGIQTSFL